MFKETHTLDKPRNPTQLIASIIFTAKTIKSGYEVVIEDENSTNASHLQNDKVHHWVYIYIREKNIPKHLKDVKN